MSRTYIPMNRVIGDIQYPDERLEAEQHQRRKLNFVTRKPVGLIPCRPEFDAFLLDHMQGGR